MKRINVIPKELSSDELEVFIDKLYSVQKEIFDGVSKDEFTEYTILSNAQKTVITILVNDSDEYVGYVAIHYFEKSIEGEMITIIKGETGILPQYRTAGTLSKIMRRSILKFKLLNPLKRSYTLSCFVTPVTYHMAAKNAYELYPNLKNKSTKHIDAIRESLTKEFGMTQVPGASEFVKHVGWVVRQSAEEQLRIDQSSSSQIAFFKQLNPDYKKGNGLQTIFPMSNKNISLTILNALFEKLGIRFKYRRF